MLFRSFLCGGYHFKGFSRTYFVGKERIAAIEDIIAIVQYVALVMNGIMMFAMMLAFLPDFGLGVIQKASYRVVPFSKSKDTREIKRVIIEDQQVKN